jgi:putative NIF3 family GTP cyclohydrolase 1 type 2
VSRVAVVGALWPELVEQAARRGADLYVSGTWRPRAAAAIEVTGITVVLVGHRPPEAWGIRTLARLIGERWPRLAVEVAPDLVPSYPR